MKKIEISQYLFRSLDIRGAEPEYVKSLHITPGSAKERSAHGSPLSPEIAKIIGRSIGEVFSPKKVVVGHDARLTSPELTKQLIEGMLDQGVDVDFIGLATTDKLYFAIGHYKYEYGIMNTGSHTIKQLNGFKISKYKDGKVMPIAKGTGMEKLSEVARAQEFTIAKKKGKLKAINISDDFENYILSFFEYENFTNQTVVFDAGNGSGGVVFESIIDRLPIKAIKLNFEPDGNFPNHEPDPMVSENLTEMFETMRAKRADFGIAWDGDSDRVAAITKSGEILTGSYFAPMLLPWVFERHPHTTVICTPPMSWASREVAQEYNGKIELAAVGNSFIKIAMEKYDSPIGMEEADHFMFSETFNAESGILPVLILLDQVTKTGKSFDELLLEAKQGYYVTGDINIEVHNAEELLQKLHKHYDELGVSNRLYLGDIQVELSDYHYNIHPSSNDPVVRLNLEAKSIEARDRGVVEVQKLINELS